MELIHRTGTRPINDVDLYVDENDVYALCRYGEPPEHFASSIMTRQELIRFAYPNRNYLGSNETSGIVETIKFILGYFPQEEVALVALEML